MRGIHAVLTEGWTSRDDEGVVWKGAREGGGERERLNGILVFVLLLPLLWNLF